MKEDKSAASPANSVREEKLVSTLRLLQLRNRTTTKAKVAAFLDERHDLLASPLIPDWYCAWRHTCLLGVTYTGVVFREEVLRQITRAPLKPMPLQEENAADGESKAEPSAMHFNELADVYAAFQHWYTTDDEESDTDSEYSNDSEDDDEEPQRPDYGPYRSYWKEGTWDVWFEELDAADQWQVLKLVRSSRPVPPGPPH